MLGSQRTSWGKAIINAITMRSQPRKGRAARMISPIVVSGGATPFIINKQAPKGGVVVAISMLSRNITENHTGSRPRDLITGIAKGITIRITPVVAINIPSINPTI